MMRQAGQLVGACVWWAGRPTCWQRHPHNPHTHTDFMPTRQPVPVHTACNPARATPHLAPRSCADRSVKCRQISWRQQRHAGSHRQPVCPAPSPPSRLRAVKRHMRMAPVWQRNGGQYAEVNPSEGCCRSTQETPPKCAVCCPIPVHCKHACLHVQAYRREKL